MVNAVAKYQKYAEYKESGVEWLGEIPSHWDGVPCRSVVEHIVEKNTNNSSDNYLSLMANIGVIRYEDKGDIGNKKPEDLSKCKIVKKGQLVINSMNYSIGSFGMSSYDGICSPVYIVLQSKINVYLERFALRVFENSSFQKYLAKFGNGILEHRSAINWDDIKDKYIPLPSLKEQKSILLFLDYETAKIDSLIEKQQKLIELLKEKRQAVISHAVTKGLNPNVSMKDSGVEWLGQVPEHWKIAPIKRIIHVMEQGKSPECENIPATSEQWGVLKTSCVNNGIFHPQQNKALPEHIKPHTKYQVKAGDILMSRASGSINLIGSVALVPNEVQENLLLSDKVFRIHLTKDCDSRFFTLLMATPYMRTLIERAISGAEGMANNITKTAILEFVSAIPPLKEQVELVNYLTQKIQAFDSLVVKACKAIEVMQERRTALISAAVTGKIDVRNWQNPTEAKMEFSA